MLRGVLMFSPPFPLFTYITGLFHMMESNTTPLITATELNQNKNKTKMNVIRPTKVGFITCLAVMDCIAAVPN